MDVTVTDQGAFRFDADQWVEKPSGYRLLDLEGTLQGEVLSGQSPTRFSVTRTGQAVPDTAGSRLPTVLAEQGYTDYLDDWFYQPTEYALLDLNQDGMKDSFFREITLTRSTMISIISQSSHMMHALNRWSLYLWQMGHRKATRLNKSKPVTGN